MRSLPVVEPRKPPRVESFPESDSWLAACEALDIAELAGLYLDDWQRYALATAMGVRDGLWSSFEVGLVVPRQNGKSEVLLARCLYGLFGKRSPANLTIYTAHEYKTARELFLRLRGLLVAPEGADPSQVAARWITDQVKTIRTANGEESVELVNGRRLRFLARTGGSGRGFTGDCVILDEAHKLNGDHMSALLPTLSARPNPQVWYAAAGPMEDSEQQLAVRDRGLVGDAGLCYLEWSVGDDADPDDEGEWDRSNPAVPHRITLDYIRKERAAMGDDDFARERLCQHNAGRRHAVIDPDVWQGLGSDVSEIVGRPVFAVDAPPERTHAAIVVAGARADGKTHVEVVEYRAGTEWAVDRLVGLAGKWKTSVVLDPASAAGGLITKLVSAGLEPLLVTGREMAQACGVFYDQVHDGQLVHYTGHGNHTHLNVAVDAGRRRVVGDAWAWHRRDAGSDISPLVAATLAVYGLGKPVQRSGKRKARVVA